MIFKFSFKIFFYLLLTQLIFSASLNEFKNKSMDYPPIIRLQQVLEEYQKIKTQGGWPALALDASEALLTARLKITRDLGLQNFQARHGLETTAILDLKTLRELNISVDERIKQINANLEAWSRQPFQLEKIHAEINILEFKFYLMEDQYIIFKSDVIVGKKSRPTPTFKSVITAIEINPDWTVPPKIARKDILPLLKTEPTEFTKKGFHFFSLKNLKEVDPSLINWSEVEDLDFPYRIVQDKGPLNPLGQIKFHFPNPYNVLIHDTPAKELFNKKVKTFSSGCIRIARAKEFAGYLIRTHSAIPIEEWQQALNSLESKKIVLSSPLPVYIFYWTAWVTPDGIIHFRNDIYKKFKK